jgi:formate/nitrite transporter FocA (FNT family)
MGRSAGDLRALLRNWGFAFTGNLVGALAVGFLMWMSGLLTGAVGETARTIAPKRAFRSPRRWRAASCAHAGVPCGVADAARSVTDKILAIVFPITGFVLLGYEHSIANMYLIPAGWAAGSPVDIGGFFSNLIPVTIGNVIGGAGGVALTYRLAYRPNGG